MDGRVREALDDLEFHVDKILHEQSSVVTSDPLRCPTQTDTTAASTLLPSIEQIIVSVDILLSDGLYRPGAGYWPFVRHLCDHEALDTITAHNCRSDKERGRVWLRAVVCEGRLEFVLSSLLGHQWLCARYYRAGAPLLRRQCLKRAVLAAAQLCQARWLFGSAHFSPATMTTSAASSTVVHKRAPPLSPSVRASLTPASTRPLSAAGLSSPQLPTVIHHRRHQQQQLTSEWSSGECGDASTESRLASTLTSVVTSLAGEVTPRLLTTRQCPATTSEAVVTSPSTDSGVLVLSTDTMTSVEDGDSVAATQPCGGSDDRQEKQPCLNRTMSEQQADCSTDVVRRRRQRWQPAQLSRRGVLRLAGAGPPPECRVSWSGALPTADSVETKRMLAELATLGQRGAPEGSENPSPASTVGLSSCQLASSGGCGDGDDDVVIQRTNDSQMVVKQQHGLPCVKRRLQIASRDKVALVIGSPSVLRAAPNQLSSVKYADLAAEELKEAYRSVFQQPDCFSVSSRLLDLPHEAPSIVPNRQVKVFEPVWLVPARAAGTLEKSGSTEDWEENQLRNVSRWISSELEVDETVCQTCFRAWLQTSDCLSGGGKSSCSTESIAKCSSSVLRACVVVVTSCRVLVVEPVVMMRRHTVSSSHRTAPTVRSVRLDDIAALQLSPSRQAVSWFSRPNSGSWSSWIQLADSAAASQLLSRLVWAASKLAAVGPGGVARDSGWIHVITTTPLHRAVLRQRSLLGGRTDGAETENESVLYSSLVVFLDCVVSSGGHIHALCDSTASSCPSTKLAYRIQPTDDWAHAFCVLRNDELRLFIGEAESGAESKLAALNADWPADICWPLIGSSVTRPSVHCCHLVLFVSNGSRQLQIMLPSESSAKYWLSLLQQATRQVEPSAQHPQTDPPVCLVRHLLITESQLLASTHVAGPLCACRDNYGAVAAALSAIERVRVCPSVGAIILELGCYDPLTSSGAWTLLFLGQCEADQFICCLRRQLQHGCNSQDVGCMFTEVSDVLGTSRLHLLAASVREQWSLPSC